MKKRHLITAVCILALTAFALSGCTTFNNFKEAFIDEPADQTGTINIGVYEPMSGADKDGASPELAGIELAHETMPEVEGKKINLIYADNSSDINAAETAINTLLTKKPDVILGSYGSIYSLVAGEYVADATTPAIAITNTNPLVTRNNSYYFRVCNNEETQGRLLAQYVASTGEEEAGILLPEKDDAATTLATAFVHEMKSLTDNDDALTFYEKYTTGDIDFSEHLAALKDSNVKYVLLPGEIKDATNIIRQASEMGLDVVFLGSTNWGTEEFFNTLTTDEAGETVFIVNPKNLAFVQFFATEGKDESNSSISEARQGFLNAYHAKYGEDQEPEEAVALGYDAYGVAVDAVLRATAGEGATLDTEETASNNVNIPFGTRIRNVLLGRGYEFDGASGVIRFNRKGDAKTTAYISTWEYGAIKAIYTIEADDQ